MPLGPQQQITVIGNMAGDPELKFTPSGAAVVNFNVAVNERVKDQATGEWGDGEASFFRVAAWNGLAENIAESLAKGQRVIVTGPLKVRNFERQDGTKGTSVEINADHVGAELTFATASITRSNKSNGGGNNGGGQQAATAQQNTNPWGAAQPAAQGAPVSDDPPF